MTDEQWSAQLSKGDEFSIDGIKEQCAVLFIGDDEFDACAETPSSSQQSFLSLLTNFGSCFRFISCNVSKVEALADQMNADNVDVDALINLLKQQCSCSSPIQIHSENENIASKLEGPWTVELLLPIFCRFGSFFEEFSVSRLELVGDVT